MIAIAVSAGAWNTVTARCAKPSHAVVHTSAPTGAATTSASVGVRRSPQPQRITSASPPAIAPTGSASPIAASSARTVDIAPSRAAIAAHSASTTATTTTAICAIAIHLAAFDSAAPRPRSGRADISLRAGISLRVLRSP
jgi:hypothetical protein